MKNLKKAISLLMIGSVLILPTAMSVQAKKAADNTSCNRASIMPTSDSVYTTPAIVTEDNVALRKTSGLSGEVLMMLQKGYFVQIDVKNAVEVDGIKWYPCKHGSVYGFIDANCVRLIATSY